LPDSRLGYIDTCCDLIAGLLNSRELSYHKKTNTGNCLGLTTLSDLETSNVSNKTFGCLNAIDRQVESVCGLVRNLLGIELDLTLKLRNEFLHFLVAAGQFFVRNLINLKNLFDTFWLLFNSGSNENYCCDFSCDANSLNALIFDLFVDLIGFIDSWLLEVKSSCHILNGSHTFCYLLIFGRQS